MNNNDLILEIKTILKEIDKSGFGISDYIKYFNKMRKILIIIINSLEVY